jgi:hypothetical protein
MREPLALMASSGIMFQVTNAKAIKLKTPATIKPLYKAGMTFFMPGEALTKKHPMIEAMMDTPPKTKG